MGAMKAVLERHPRLFPQLYVTDDVFQWGHARDSGAVWMVLTDSMEDVHEGEFDVLDQVVKTPWTDGETKQRSFTNEVRGEQLHTSVWWTPSEGRRWSTYSWHKDRWLFQDLWGGGSDEVLRIVDSKGEPAGFLCISLYASNYGNTWTTQLEAIQKWRGAIESRATMRAGFAKGSGR